jgi:hypothetical protein
VAPLLLDCISFPVLYFLVSLCLSGKYLTSPLVDYEANADISITQSMKLRNKNEHNRSKTTRLPATARLGGVPALPFASNADGCRVRQ